MKKGILPLKAALNFPSVECLKKQLVQLEIGGGGTLAESLAEGGRHLERERLEIGSPGGWLGRMLRIGRRWRRRCRWSRARDTLDCLSHRPGGLRGQRGEINGRALTHGIISFMNSPFPTFL